uniref:Putative secreted protein n=1 Tax=Ixodes scapularis TaxID=6945 RepID=A0A4D5RZG4_IXOSC
MMRTPCKRISSRTGCLAVTAVFIPSAEPETSSLAVRIQDFEALKRVQSRGLDTCPRWSTFRCILQNSRTPPWKSLQTCWAGTTT